MRLDRFLPLLGTVMVASLAGILPADAQNAFITNTGDNTVSIVDVPSGTVIGAVPVDSEPQGVAVAPNGTTAYVASLFGGVSVIDAAQFPQTVTATIATGTFPPGVALSPDGTRAYVTNGLTSTPEVSFIDTSNNTVTASVAVPGTPAGVAVSPDGTKLYVANGTTGGLVSVVSTTTNSLIGSISVGDSPDGVAITPDGSKLYVTQFLNSGSVTVINPATGLVTGSIVVGGGPIGVAVSPNGTQVFVANHNDNNVSVISTATNTVTTTIPVGQGPFGVSFTTDGAKAYVANKTDNTVSEIDVASDTVVKTIAVGSAPAAFGSDFIGKAQPASVLLSAVLPGGRSVQVGSTATIYATILNTGANALNNCRILLPTSAPSGMSMFYETTDPSTNTANSGQNPPVSIAANGSQTFVLAFQGSSGALDPSQPLLFVCGGTTYAPITLGVNSIDLQFSTTPVPDIIALAATSSANGIVNVPFSAQQAGAFAVASDNIGAAAPITATVDTGSATLPIIVTMCQTNGSGQCLAPPASSVALANYATGQTPTFSIFVTATAAVPLNPGSSRVFVRFLDSNGLSHGSTSVAVQTN
ncbi:MAG TPA: beta-propeller fold lactonase family protein [Aliidongia sp.]|uniref:beta-propeller fold lactonase family protein n=1 Tax=Aliidongia sp. TaxID=1914230 RepID=UPI002DDDB32D|nr:beta-propeller fold lactonase family protein [Aliidongia sp.]HEV2676079.1 beta-propeller fold lactonase family protein [Aliidongia sp.]